jgi:hypothetical protein
MAEAEAESWLAAQPKNDKGKVPLGVVIAESKRRGYCICPKPMRQLINITGLKCSWCFMTETNESSEFWYGRGPAAAPAVEAVAEGQRPAPPDHASADRDLAQDYP